MKHAIVGVVIIMVVGAFWSCYSHKEYENQFQNSDVYNFYRLIDKENAKEALEYLKKYPAIATAPSESYDNNSLELAIKRYAITKKKGDWEALLLQLMLANIIAYQKNSFDGMSIQDIIGFSDKHIKNYVKKFSIKKLIKIALTFEKKYEKEEILEDHFFDRFTKGSSQQLLKFIQQNPEWVTKIASSSGNSTLHVALKNYSNSELHGKLISTIIAVAPQLVTMHDNNGNTIFDVMQSFDDTPKQEMFDIVREAVGKLPISKELRKKMEITLQNNDPKELYKLVMEFPQLIYYEDYEGHTLLYFIQKSEIIEFQKIEELIKKLAPDMQENSNVLLLIKR